MNENSHEYSFVANLFLSTWNGVNPNVVMPNPVKKYYGKKPQPAIMMRPPFVGGLPFGGGVSEPTIIKVEKLFNCVVYDKFINEYRRMLRKYPNRKTTYLMKHLFHGCNQTDPKLIWQSEDGLDIRFANSGALGQGIYFANNSAYSNSFAYSKGNGEK